MALKRKQTSQAMEKSKMASKSAQASQHILSENPILLSHGGFMWPPGQTGRKLGDGVHPWILHSFKTKELVVLDRGWEYWSCYIVATICEFMHGCCREGLVLHDGTVPFIYALPTIFSSDAFPSCRPRCAFYISCPVGGCIWELTCPKVHLLMYGSQQCGTRGTGGVTPVSHGWGGNLLHLIGLHHKTQINWAG